MEDRKNQQIGDTPQMSNTAQNRIGVSDDKGTFSMLSSEQPKEMSEVGGDTKTTIQGQSEQRAFWPNLGVLPIDMFGPCLKVHYGQTREETVAISLNYVDVGPFWAGCTYSEHFTCG